MFVALWNPIKKEKKGAIKTLWEALAAPSGKHCWQLGGTRDVLESQENIAGSKAAGTKLRQG